MKLAAIILLLVALVLFGWGYAIDHGGGSADERVGAVVPWFVALVLVITAVVLDIIR